MKFENTDLRAMANIISGKTKLPAEFSAEGVDLEAVNEAFCEQIKEITKDYRTFKQHKAELFSIIEENIDTILPNMVEQYLGEFAEIKNLANGDKNRFLVEKNKGGIKNSVTEVGLGGQFKRYKMDKGYVEPEMKAYGTATSIELEELRAGLLNWANWRMEVTEGIAENIMHKVNEGLQAAVSAMASRQKDSASGFDATKFDTLLARAKSYGEKVKIVCTEMFAQKLPIDTYSQVALQEKRDYGYVRKYKGADVQIIPNALKDNTSTAWQIDNGFAYIMPVGKNAKIVKVTLEGQSEIDEYKDQDTKETVYEVYDKAGVAVVNQPYVFVYEDTAL